MPSQFAGDSDGFCLPVLDGVRDEFAANAEDGMCGRIAESRTSNVEAGGHRSVAGDEGGRFEDGLREIAFAKSIALEVPETTPQIGSTGLKHLVGVFNES